MQVVDDEDKTCRWIGGSSNVISFQYSSFSFTFCPLKWLSNPSDLSPLLFMGNQVWQKGRWNIRSDGFMVDDFNIRSSSQWGYTLESFNSQWSRRPLNQYGTLWQNGCVPWKPCRSQCNLIQPLGQASLNRNGKKNVGDFGGKTINFITVH